MMMMGKAWRRVAPLMLAISPLSAFGAHNLAPYVCDNYTYVNNDPQRSSLDPNIDWRGFGYPIVWESGAFGKYTMNPDCKIAYEDEQMNLYSSFYYNASVFGIGQTYVARAKIQMNKEGERDSSIGVIAWQRGEGQHGYHKISFDFQKATESDGVTYHFTAYAYSGNSNDIHFDIDRSYSCLISRQEDAIDLEVYVFDSRHFTFVARVGGDGDLKATIVQFGDFSDFTNGTAPQFVGIEANQVGRATFRDFGAEVWSPTAVPVPVESRTPCPNENNLVAAFFSILGAIIVVIVWQIFWAYRHIKSNYTLGNEPSLMDLVASGIAGLQFFSVLGQVFYLWFCIKLGSQEKQYIKFLYITLGLFVFNLLYNAAVLAYTLVQHGNHLKSHLLARHRFSYLLLILMTTTNLNLLVLYPWDYDRFPAGDHLDGYPTPTVMRLCVLPAFIQSFPIIIIQVLTNGMNTGYNAAESVLFTLTGISSVHTIVQSLSRVFQTYEVDEEKIMCDMESVVDGETKLEDKRLTTVKV